MSVQSYEKIFIQRPLPLQKEIFQNRIVLTAEIHYLCSKHRNRTMKTKIILLCAVALAVCSCDNPHQEAQNLMSSIKENFSQGHYPQTLSLIDSLRKNYPKEIELRKEALKIYQDAALKMAQNKLMQADSALQSMTAEYEKRKAEVEGLRSKGTATAEDLSGVTKMKIKLDSVKTRFDAEVARVKFIHKKQAEN